MFANWWDVSKPEFYKFLAILIVTGIDKKPSIKYYWYTHVNMHSTFCRNTMSRDHLEAIYHTMLHVGDTQAKGKYKIEPLMDLTQKFQAAFNPYCNVSIDEMVIGWKKR